MPPEQPPLEHNPREGDIQRLREQLMPESPTYHRDLEIAGRWRTDLQHDLGEALARHDSVDRLIELAWQRIFLDHFAPIDPTVRAACQRLTMQVLDRDEPELYDRILFMMDDADTAPMERGLTETRSALLIDFAATVFQRAPNLQLETVDLSRQMRRRAHSELLRLGVAPLKPLKLQQTGRWRGVPVVVSGISPSGLPVFRPQDPNLQIVHHPDGSSGVQGSRDTETVFGSWNESLSPRELLADFVPDESR